MKFEQFLYKYILSIAIREILSKLCDSCIYYITSSREYRAHLIHEMQTQFLVQYLP